MITNNKLSAAFTFQISIGYLTCRKNIKVVLYLVGFLLIMNEKM